MTKKVLQIPRPERRRLLAMARKARAPVFQERCFIILALARRIDGREVARTFGVAPAHVSRTRSIYRAEGIEGLMDKRCNNGHRKATKAFRSAVADLLLKVPTDFQWMRPTWTRELLCLQMERNGFERVADCTMSRVLSDLGARLGRPKPVVLCPWPRPKRQRVLREIRRLETRASPLEPVLYVDEVDIHLNPKIGRDWMLPGHQRLVVTPGKNQKFYLAGALDVRTGKLETVGDFAKNSQLFGQLLFRLAARYRSARKIHLVLDNYCIHHSRLITRILDSLGAKVVLHFLPPYCPDHNRIERVWLDLHANVTRNHRCKNMRQLLQNTRIYLSGYQWSRVAKSKPSPLRAAA